METENAEIASIRLGGNKFVVLSKYEKTPYIHTREYETKSNGSLFPTKRGVALNESRLSEFLDRVDDISSIVRGEKIASPQLRVPTIDERHLGGGVMVTIKKEFKCVDFRRYFKPENSQTPVPTKSGIHVKFSEWNRLISIIKKYRKMEPEFKEPKACRYNEDHQNQIGALRCRECNPFNNDYLDY